MIRSIVVICTGNVCRSPMAASMLRAAFPAKNVLSAGIGALVDHPADPIALRLMHERGLELNGHRARQLDFAMLQACELALVMEQEHKTWVESTWCATAGKVYRWGHWSGFDIPDPYRCGERAFRDVLALLDQGLDDWRGKL
ncbi:MAG TPA: low molecular weight protein-tyrosine-phosphatase [Gammaproteobacteria bacterium]